MPAPVIPVAILGIGAYLAWFLGVHYWGSDTRWPTDPVKDVLQGKPLPAPGGQQTAAGIAAGIEGGAGASASASAGAPAQSGNYDVPALESLWTSQGGSPATAFEAANIAMAESSGRPAVTSGNPDGGTNVGLWQLDTKGVGSGYTVEQLQDPATNARITIMHTANGTVWTQWADSVVHNGAYTGPKA